MQARREVVALRPEVIAQPNPAHTVCECLTPLDVGGEKQHEKRRSGPQRWAARKHQPSGGKQNNQRERKETSTKVVGYFPARDSGQVVPRARAALCWNGAPQPGEQLPVAAAPSMETGGPGKVVAGIIVDHFEVGAERDPRVQAFEQIVTQ